MLAGWIAAAAGLELTDAPMTVGPVRAGDTLTLERDGNGWRLSGRASRLPYARAAGAIVLIAEVRMARWRSRWTAPRAPR